MLIIRKREDLAKFTVVDWFVPILQVLLKCVSAIVVVKLSEWQRSVKKERRMTPTVVDNLSHSVLLCGEARAYMVNIINAMGHFQHNHWVFPMYGVFFFKLLSRASMTPNFKRSKCIFTHSWLKQVPWRLHVYKPAKLFAFFHWSTQHGHTI